MESNRRKARQNAEEAREHVLDVAQRLFYWHGVRATGVDRVAAEAGVAPTALYRLFASKELLVAAYIARTDERYREWFEQAIRADGRRPGRRIVALFEALVEQVQSDKCRGCPFSMALTEFPDAGVEAHRGAVRLKKWVRSRLRRLANEHAAERAEQGVDPAALADHLMLLLEGVYATMPALGATGPAKRVRELVAALVGEFEVR